jgi:hypothetical protein
MRGKLVIAFILTGFLSATAQQGDTILTLSFAADLAKLVKLNSSTVHSIDVSGKEAINLEANATVEQIIEITKPYLTSSELNAKYICRHLLGDALFRKVKNERQKQQLVEVLCKNYLDSDHDIQVVANTLLQQSEKDFTPAAKEYISSLLDPKPKSLYDVCAKLLAIAQIKESIPALWKILNKQIETMTLSDVNVLASLARMGEKKASLLLCNYYNYHKNRTDYRYIFASKSLAFSLDSSVLYCLIDDFRTLDLSTSFQDVDASFSPGGYLAIYISAMIKNYPYPKEDYKVDKKQLLAWLNETAQIELEQK